MGTLSTLYVRILRGCGPVPEGCLFPPLVCGSWAESALQFSRFLEGPTCPLPPSSIEILGMTPHCVRIARSRNAEDP